jgi:hypothetical protein
MLFLTSQRSGLFLFVARPEATPTSGLPGATRRIRTDDLLITNQPQASIVYACVRKISRKSRVFLRRRQAEQRREQRETFANGP